MKLNWREEMLSQKLRNYFHYVSLHGVEWDNNNPQSKITDCLYKEILAYYEDYNGDFEAMKTENKLLFLIRAGLLNKNEYDQMYDDLQARVNSQRTVPGLKRMAELKFVNGIRDFYRSAVDYQYQLGVQRSSFDQDKAFLAIIDKAYYDWCNNDFGKPDFRMA